MGKVFYRIGRSSLYLVLVSFLCGAIAGKIPEGTEFSMEGLLVLMVMTGIGWISVDYIRSED